MTKVSLNYGFMPLWSRDGRTLFYFTSFSQFVAAHIVESPDFKVMSTEEIFTRPGPGTGPQGANARWTTDMLPNGDVVYLTTAPPPAVTTTAAAGGAAGTAGGLAAGQARGTRTAGSARAAIIADYRPRLIAIVNWLGVESAAKPTR